jgi:sulfur relay (sulfurtransferase) DsrF/TusC family protein
MRKLSQQICKELKKSSPRIKKKVLEQETVFLYDENKTAVWCHIKSTESEQIIKADRNEGLEVLDETQLKAFEKLNKELEKKED